MRKKLLTTICTLAMALAFCACGEKEEAGKNDVTGTPAVEQEDATKDDTNADGEMEDEDKTSEDVKDVDKEDETKEEEKVSSGPLYFTEVEYSIEGTTFKMPNSCRELEALGWTAKTEKTLAPGTISDYLVAKAPYAHPIYLTVANPGTEEVSVKDGVVVGISISASKEIKLQKEVAEIDFMGVSFGDSHDEMLAALGTDYSQKIDQGFGMYTYYYDLGNGATLRVDVWEEDGGVVNVIIENCDRSKVIY